MVRILYSSNVRSVLRLAASTRCKRAVLVLSRMAKFETSTVPFYTAHVLRCASCLLSS